MFRMIFASLALASLSQESSANSQCFTSHEAKSWVFEWSTENGVAVTNDAQLQIAQRIEASFRQLMKTGKYKSRELRSALRPATRKLMNHLTQDGEVPQFEALLVEEMSPGGAFFLWPTQWPTIEINTNVKIPEVVMNGKPIPLSDSQRQKRPLIIIGTTGNLLLELREAKVSICKKKFHAEEGEKYSMICRY